MASSRRSAPRRRTRLARRKKQTSLGRWGMSCCTPRHVGRRAVLTALRPLLPSIPSHPCEPHPRVNCPYSHLRVPSKPSRPSCLVPFSCPFVNSSWSSCSRPCPSLSCTSISVIFPRKPDFQLAFSPIMVYNGSKSEAISLAAYTVAWSRLLSSLCLGSSSHQLSPRRVTSRLSTRHYRGRRPSKFREWRSADRKVHTPWLQT